MVRRKIIKPQPAGSAVAFTSNIDYCVTGSILGLEVTFLLDTGAHHCLLGRQTWGRIRSNLKTFDCLVQETAEHSVSYTGEPFHLLGTATLVLTLDCVSTIIQFRLTEGKFGDILGADFFQTYCRSMDFQGERLLLSTGDGVPIHRVWSPHHSKDTARDCKRQRRKRKAVSEEQEEEEPSNSQADI